MDAHEGGVEPRKPGFGITSMQYQYYYAIHSHNSNVLTSNNCWWHKWTIGSMKYDNLIIKFDFLIWTAICSSIGPFWKPLIVCQR
jgi:hypothetical protein